MAVNAEKAGQGHPKRLLIVNDNHCEIDSSDGCGRFSNSTFHHFLQYFSKVNVTLSSPCLNNIKSVLDLIIDGVGIKTRIPYGTAARFYLLAPNYYFRYFLHFLRVFKNFDCIMIVVPACSAPSAYLAASILRKQKLCYIVGDVSEVVQIADRGIISVFSSMAAKWEEIFTRFMVKRIPAFVLGSRLYNKYEPHSLDLRPAMTSLVSSSQVQKPESTPLEAPYKLITVGRLSREKGIDVAIKAVAALSSEGIACQYTIVGDGPYKRNLIELTAELGVVEHVRFQGKIDNREQLSELYRGSDIFLLPSLSEGIPKVILEALAFSLSIIATDVGGVVDLLGEKGERGWIVKPDCVDSCVKVIKQCIQNEEQTNKKKAASYIFIQDHTAEKEAGRIEELVISTNK